MFISLLEITVQTLQLWANRITDALVSQKARLGQATLICGMGMVIVGFPAQIMANYQAQECGINPILVLVATVLYSVRIPYQIATQAWYLLPADALGLLFSLILMGQYLMY